MCKKLRIFSERIYHNQEKNYRKQTLHLLSYTTKRKLILILESVALKREVRDTQII